MNATMALESMPPDRNAPIGTSETICICTDRPILERMVAIQSDSDTLSSTAVGGTHVLRTVTPAASTRSNPPIGNLRMLLNIESGAGT